MIQLLQARIGGMDISRLRLSNYEQAFIKKRTKGDKFLAQTNHMVSWQALIALIEPQYPRTSSKGGQQIFPLATMLRIHLIDIAST